MLLLLCNVLAIYIVIHLPLIEDGSLLADCLIKRPIAVCAIGLIVFVIKLLIVY